MVMMLVWFVLECGHGSRRMAEAGDGQEPLAFNSYEEGSTFFVILQFYSD
jgi:hypothetical protein